MNGERGVKHAQTEGTLMDPLPLTVRNTVEAMRERKGAGQGIVFMTGAGRWWSLAAVYLGRAESGRVLPRVPYEGKGESIIHH